MTKTPATEIVETADGSKTLRHVDLGVTYRSVHGAREESQVVFVDGTWSPQSTRRVLELGLGAGTNLALTIEHARQNDYELDYFVFERAPVASTPVDASDEARGMIAELLGGEGARREVHREGIHITMYAAEWGDVRLDQPVDSVYFDPFGPSVNPEAWTARAFEFAVGCMKAEAILGTYSAASAVKRAMVAAGLFIATAAGPGRKREITFAARAPEALERFELLDREKYR